MHQSESNLLMEKYYSTEPLYVVSTSAANGATIIIYVSGSGKLIRVLWGVPPIEKYELLQTY